MTLHASVTLFTGFTFVTTGTLWTLEEEQDVLSRVQDTYCPRAHRDTEAPRRTEANTNLQQDHEHQQDQQSQEDQVDPVTQ